MPAVPSPIKLNDVCANLAQTAPQPLTYEGLCSWVEGIDWTQSDWADHVPEVDMEDDYARNILCLEPFEVVLLHWPAGVESAVHHHKGFWGTVVCLQGVLENVTYNLEDGVLTEKDVLRALPKGIVPEPDGTIHRIRNGSDQDALVTLHFYHPALEDLDGLVLYDLSTGSSFTCNETAPTASIHLPASNYRGIQHQAFRFTPLPKASHVQCNIVPKPDAEAIERMLCWSRCYLYFIVAAQAALASVVSIDNNKQLHCAHLHEPLEKVRYVTSRRRDLRPEHGCTKPYSAAMYSHARTSQTHNLHQY